MGNRVAQSKAICLGGTDRDTNIGVWRLGKCVEAWGDVIQEFETKFYELEIQEMMNIDALRSNLLQRSIRTSTGNGYT